MSPPAPSVTVSTKTWEGDYRTILSPQGIEDLFGPLGRSPVRQVVLNRIEDVATAEKLAARLVDAGVIDNWAWAEARWPELFAQAATSVELVRGCHAVFGSRAMRARLCSDRIPPPHRRRRSLRSPGRLAR